MTHEFDKGYWDSHWRQAQDGPASASGAPNPYVVRETGGLVPGTALDAGCGEGADASWLAAQGWQVTGVDISTEALARAAGRATPDNGPVRWVEADLGTWEPERQLDLVMTSYAHPAMPQLAFYDRISAWVAPGGTLLVVGHLHTPGATGHDHEPPEQASVTLADITALLDDARWEVETAEEHVREVPGHAGPLHDVVVRATRRRTP
ncbi:class I SAM-dependent methyltransferase [Nocardioides sp. MAHUQ-72]|uniref:class I SAM-dependent methyltransferase n=1 Tax=unclassified Nocardioides TaxID=2615069 RepID=UPI00360ED7E7